jgi:hypothetical protein
MIGFGDFVDSMKEYKMKKIERKEIFVEDMICLC